MFVILLTNSHTTLSYREETLHLCSRVTSDTCQGLLNIHKANLCRTGQVCSIVNTFVLDPHLDFKNTCLKMLTSKVKQHCYVHSLAELVTAVLLM